MTDKAKAVHRKIRDVMDDSLIALSSTEYRDVLGELAGDIDGKLSAILEELAEDE